MNTTTKRKVKPLSDAERIDWRNDLDDIEECCEAGLALGRALVDVKTRKLYREEYKSWKDFLERCPQLGISRSRSYQLMEYAESVEQLSTIVDTAALKEGESRCLEAVACIPDRAEVLKRIRAANLPVNEKNVECFYHEYRAEKEAKDKERADLSKLTIFDPQPETQTEEEAPKDDSQEERAKERAKNGEFDKERRYAVRMCDHARLFAKDATKSNKEDFSDPELRQKARQALALTRKGCDRIERMLDQWDSEEGQADTA